MVAIRTILTLGVIAVAAVIFIGAGGARGLGTKIGGGIGSGLQQFSSSLSSAFTGGLFGGPQNPNDVGSSQPGGIGQIGPAPRTGTEEFDPFGNLLGNFKGLQNILDTINNTVSNLFRGGTQPSAGVVQQPRITDQGFVRFTEASLGRSIDTSRSVAARRLAGKEVFVDTFEGRTRTFATEASRAEFIRRTQ